MVLKIKFVYSEIYDDYYKKDKWVNSFLGKRKQEYPQKKQTLSYLKSIEKFWKKDEKKILKKISGITGLKWKEKGVNCYIVGFCVPISDPLTLQIFKYKNDFIDVLTHELIHQIQIQNMDKWPKWGRYLIKKYKKEPFIISGHIFLHAVHWKVIEELFGKSRLKKIINSDKNFKNSKRIWEIVEEEGPEKIINKFRKLTK